MLLFDIIKYKGIKGIKIYSYGSFFIVINFGKWVYRGMGILFLLDTLKVVLEHFFWKFKIYLKVLHNTLLLIYIYIYIESIKTFWRRKLYTKTCYSSKSLWILTIFLISFFEPKFLNTTKLKNTSEVQNVLILPSSILLKSVATVQS